MTHLAPYIPNEQILLFFALPFLECLHSRLMHQPMPSVWLGLLRRMPTYAFNWTNHAPCILRTMSVL